MHKKNVNFKLLVLGAQKELNTQILRESLVLLVLWTTASIFWKSDVDFRILVLQSASQLVSILDFGRNLQNPRQIDEIF